MSIPHADLPTRPKCVPPIPVPTQGPGGLFSVACSTTIAAPPKTCLEKVLDPSSYAAWNGFITSASLISPGRDADVPAELRGISSPLIAPGAKMNFAAVMKPGNAPRNVEVEVTVLESSKGGGVGSGGSGKGYRVAWKGLGWPGLLLRSERVQEFLDGEDEAGNVITRYASWETFAGVLAHLIPRTQLEDGFGRWMDGLKKVVEEEAK
ncbi:hypothetical protein GGR50DRAFT_691266 [Xylaria sp. CBS 124048]|nr:hypothetical protein GGR50DRAFT_691266 [Xylaria sp. CBS 124048]